MANKYARDNYLILVFDRYGTRQDTIVRSSGGYIDALKTANDVLSEGESFVITRVLRNSLDNNENWRTPEEG